jgi:hypothetical protein
MRTLPHVSNQLSVHSITTKAMDCVEDDQLVVLNAPQKQYVLTVTVELS